MQSVREGSRRRRLAQSGRRLGLPTTAGRAARRRNAVGAGGVEKTAAGSVGPSTRTPEYCGPGGQERKRADRSRSLGGAAGAVDDSDSQRLPARRRAGRSGPRGRRTMPSRREPEPDGRGPDAEERASNTATQQPSITAVGPERAGRARRGAESGADCGGAGSGAAAWSHASERARRPRDGSKAATRWKQAGRGPASKSARGAGGGRCGRWEPVCKTG